MAQWGTNDWNSFTVGGTTYNFAPNQLVFVGNIKYEKNQIVQEAESGEIKIQELDTNLRRMFEFTVDRMPDADWTHVTSTTIRGYSTLETMITGTAATNMNFRETTATLKIEGDGIGTTYTVRYWGGVFGPIPVVRKSGTSTAAVRWHGRGSNLLVFREDI